MRLCATLPMYDWPEARAGVDAFWAAVRAALPGRGLPDALERPADEAGMFALWRDPGLVLGQACWGPLGLGLLPGLRVLAQPDYADVEGGRGPFYRSAIVMRAGEAAGVPAHPGAMLPVAALRGLRLAATAEHSLSGWLALRDDLAAAEETPERLFGAVVWSGGHRASVRMVAAGQADAAAVDCRSWAMACRHEPAARGLVVVGWTAERPGLPYVCAAGIDHGMAGDMAATLHALGAHPPTA